MKIYELRAYIGETRLFYTQLFTTMDAALKRAEYLLKVERVDMRRGSVIRELTQDGDQFTHDWLKSTPVYLT